MLIFLILFSTILLLICALIVFDSFFATLGGRGAGGSDLLDKLGHALAAT